MNRITQEQLSKTIKLKREELGMSQLDLAKKTKINRAMISKIENNTYMPSISQLEDLQEALGFSLEEIRENKNRTNRKTKLEPKKIAVAGTGYVGMSIAVLLAQHNKVVAVDIVEEKVKRYTGSIQFKIKTHSVNRGHCTARNTGFLSIFRTFTKRYEGHL